MGYQIPSAPNPIDSARLAQLREAAGDGPVLILTHDNPDPDSLASGKALAALFGAWQIPTQLIYSGLVARAENLAVLKRLTPEWEHQDRMRDLDLSAYTAIALIDTQPGAGNNRLPDAYTAQIVLDHHHPIRDKIAQVRYVDVRPELGATTTMVYQYMDAVGIEPDPILATAMFYGVKIDTRGLSRGASPADEVAYLYLLARLDQGELIQVEQAGLPLEYYRAFGQGLHATRVYDHSVVARLGQMIRPDFAAEMADLLIRLEGAQAVLCLGQHEDTIHLSLRTKPLMVTSQPLTNDAGQLIQNVVVPPGRAGGHRSLAGGQVPLEGQSAEAVTAEIEQRFLSVMEETSEGVLLLE